MNKILFLQLLLLALPATTFTCQIALNKVEAQAQIDGTALQAAKAQWLTYGDQLVQDAQDEVARLLNLTTQDIKTAE